MRSRPALVAALAVSIVPLAVGDPAAHADDQPSATPMDLGEYREADPETEAKPAPPEEAHPEGEYGGVAPGKAKPAPKRKPKIPARPTVTWIGFQELDAGSSRIFLQLSRTATYQQNVVGNELVVTLPEFALAPTNNTRPLDTKFFETAIARVAAKPTRAKGRKSPRTVEVRVQFKSAADARQADARVESAQDGYHYLYLDFGPPAAASGS